MKDPDDGVDRRTEEKGAISKLQFLVSGAEMNKAANGRNKLSLGEAGRVGQDVFHLFILSFIQQIFRQFLPRDKYCLMVLNFELMNPVLFGFVGLDNRSLKDSYSGGSQEGDGVGL